MKGYDVPVYANIVYPFWTMKMYSIPGVPIKNSAGIPHDWNPVGSYKRNFKIPSDWKDKEIFLQFRGSKFGILCMGK